MIVDQVPTMLFDILKEFSVNNKHDQREILKCVHIETPDPQKPKMRRLVTSDAYRLCILDVEADMPYHWDSKLPPDGDYYFTKTKSTKSAYDSGKSEVEFDPIGNDYKFPNYKRVFPCEPRNTDSWEPEILIGVYVNTSKGAKLDMRLPFCFDAGKLPSYCRNYKVYRNDRTSNLPPLYRFENQDIPLNLYLAGMERDKELEL